MSQNKIVQPIAMLSVQPQLLLTFKDVHLTNKAPIARLTITNVTKSELAFKVGFTRPENYNCIPNRGVIHALQTLTLKVLVRSLAPSKEDLLKHKISISVTELKGEYHHFKIWEGLCKSDIELHRLKFHFEDLDKVTIPVVYPFEDVYDILVKTKGREEDPNAAIAKEKKAATSMESLSSNDLMNTDEHKISDCFVINTTFICVSVTLFFAAVTEFLLQ